MYTECLPALVSDVELLKGIDFLVLLLVFEFLLPSTVLRMW